MPRTLTFAFFKMQFAKLVQQLHDYTIVTVGERTITLRGASHCSRPTKLRADLRQVSSTLSIPYRRKSIIDYGSPPLAKVSGSGFGARKANPSVSDG